MVRGRRSVLRHPPMIGETTMGTIGAHEWNGVDSGQTRGRIALISTIRCGLLLRWFVGQHIDTWFSGGGVGSVDYSGISSHGTTFVASGGKRWSTCIRGGMLTGD